MIEVIEMHTHTLATFMPDCDGRAFVECQCGAAISGETEAAAIAAWNRRAGQNSKLLTPEKHGRWIYVPKETDEGCDTWRCSVCGARFVTEFGFEEQSFCPECGAKMDGGERE